LTWNTTSHTAAHWILIAGVLAEITDNNNDNTRIVFIKDLDNNNTTCIVVIKHLDNNNHTRIVVIKDLENNNHTRILICD